MQRAAHACRAHLCVQHVQPPVGDRCHCVVALLQAAAGQELLKDLRLEQLDQLQLATTLQEESRVHAQAV
jgi:hypothetical protein